jgi:biofilm PGA synthesis N-glycosyltransferase PgaC
VPVSVIISARNEARNLTENLPYILQQNYPDYEVVVINDCSTDDSDLILQDIQREFAHLKIVTVTNMSALKRAKSLPLH